MEVKEAIKIAKSHAATVFEGETIRLEEVWFEDDKGQWCVTVGLQRQEPSLLRVGIRTHYKTLRVDDKTAAVISVRNHDKMPVSPA